MALYFVCSRLLFTWWILSKVFLSDEQKTVFAYEDNPDLMLGAYNGIYGDVLEIEKVMTAFKTGAGVDYGAFYSLCFPREGTARCFKPKF